MATASEEAVLESVVFLDCFSDLPGPRQLAKVVYPLGEILLLVLLATLAGAETFTAMAEFGKAKIDLLRRLKPFANGTPEHDRIGTVFAALDAERFQQCFVNWVAALTGISTDVIAIDGKTSRGSRKRSEGQKPIHMVSAFSAKQRLVLGQIKVDGKSNEITAIPKFLEMLDIEGAIITIDAMGCQRDIAKKILDKGADYILALKGNQGTLRDDVELFANDQKSNNFKGSTVSHHEAIDASHGRIVTRRTTVFHDIDWLQKRHDWPGLKGVVMVESERQINNKTEHETRYYIYITSSTDPASKLSKTVQQHWSVESMHWLMDCLLRDDECRVRTNHAPANFTTIKHITLNLLRRNPARISMTSKRLKAGWSDEFLLELIS